MRTKNEILLQFGIDTLTMSDDFNTALFYAMEEYASSQMPKFININKSLPDIEKSKHDQSRVLVIYEQFGKEFQDVCIYDHHLEKWLTPKGAVVTHWRYLDPFPAPVPVTTLD